MLNLKRILGLGVHIITVVGRHSRLFFDKAGDPRQHVFDVLLCKAVQAQLRQSRGRIIGKILILLHEAHLQIWYGASSDILRDIENIVLDRAVINGPVIRHTGHDQKIHKPRNKIHLLRDNRPSILETDRSQKQLRLQGEVHLRIIENVLCFLRKGSFSRT